MTGQIYIKDLRLHAYHGVLKQERIVGNDYVVNLTVYYPIEKACLSDSVADTMNYADALKVIQHEMGLPSNLLEHVAHRICRSILSAFPLATAVDIDIAKVAPPMRGDCAAAGVRLHMTQGE